MLEKRNPCVLCGDIACTDTMKSMESLKKLKIVLRYDLAIPLLGYTLEGNEITMLKKYCTPTFIAALFTIVKTWKQAGLPWLLGR